MPGVGGQPSAELPPSEELPWGASTGGRAIAGGSTGVPTGGATVGWSSVLVAGGVVNPTGVEDGAGGGATVGGAGMPTAGDGSGGTTIAE